MAVKRSSATAARLLSYRVSKPQMPTNAKTRDHTLSGMMLRVGNTKDGSFCKWGVAPPNFWPQLAATAAHLLSCAATVRRGLQSRQETHLVAYHALKRVLLVGIVSPCRFLSLSS